MRNGGGPTVVEADTYRYFHQNGPFPGSAFGYRSKLEEASWRDRDPIAKIEGHLVRRGLYTEDELAGVRKSIKAAMGEIGAGLVEPDPARQAGPAAHPPGAVAGPGVPRRRHPRRPVEPRGADRPRGERLRARRARAAQVRRGRRGRDGAPHGGRPVGRRDGRGRPPAQRRIARRHQGAQGEVRGPGVRHADLRGRVQRTRRRPGARRPVLPRRRADVRRLHLGGGGPAVQPDRQGPPHVRRRPRHAAAAAHQDRHRHRLRVPALDGPGRRPRHLGRLADHRAVHAAGLRGPGQRRDEAEGPGGRARARRRPLQDLGPRAEARLRLHPAAR